MYTFDKAFAKFPNEYLCNTYTAEMDIILNEPKTIKY